MRYIIYRLIVVVILLAGITTNIVAKDSGIWYPTIENGMVITSSQEQEPPAKEPKESEERVERVRRVKRPSRYDSLRFSQQEIDKHRANRGLVNLENNFIPKGQWITGFTASYSTHDNDNYQILLVEDISSVGYSVSASPMIAYTFANNSAAGGRFVYSRSLLKIDDANLSVAGTDLSLLNYYSITDSYTGKAIMRQYIPFGRQKRLAFFAEIQLEGGVSYSMMAYDYPVIGTYAKGYHLGFGVVPGLVAFATNSIAFEVSVGVLGINYSHIDQVGNQVYLGNIDNTNLNLKINLLTIGVGVSFYL